ncbi:MAG: F0F1 ATP synthase subunit delta [Bacillota bacterium]|nr:F0F1 ATP synthase subunit delta [Bacillota bacterium]
MVRVLCAALSDATEPEARGAIAEALQALAGDYLSGGPTRAVMLSPEFAGDERYVALRMILPAEVPDQLAKALALLAERGAAGQLPALSALFRRISRGGKQVTISAPWTLRPEHRARLAAALQLDEARDEVVWEEDLSLLAGLTVQAGGRVWDFSVRETLERLRRVLREVKPSGPK